MERKRDSLVSWRGRDEYDRFAEALGSTLPRITDQLTESSAAATSEGDTEYQEIIESVEEKTPIERSIPKAARKAKIEMAGLMKMSSFEGRADGKENPSDYIADVEMAAMVWDATIGQNTDNADAWKITLFRQNLDKNGDAWHWWTNILKPEAKQSFATIKAAFLGRYEIARNKTVLRFNVQNELMLLQQRDGQSIAEYVHEAEQLSERVPDDMNSMLAMVFIRGLADQETRRKMSYDLRDESEVTFAKALRMVKSWHQEIGAPDPFNPNSVGFNSYRANSSALLYAKPSSGAVAMAQGERTGSAEASSGEKSPNGFPNQETFNQMMLNFMQTMKQDFRISPHRTPGVINTATGGGGFVSRQTATPRNVESRAGRVNGGIICFNCGGEGHFSTGCTNVPLTYAEQKRIREQFRADREARQRDTSGIGASDHVAGGAQPVSMVRSSQDGVNDASRVVEVISEDNDPKASPVSCIKVVSLAADKKVVGQACATLMRMPAVAAIFEKAMVDKRVRVDDDYEQPARASKQPRTDRPTTRSGTGAGSSSRLPPGPQILTDTTPEPDSDSEEDGPIVLENPRARIEVPAPTEQETGETRPVQQPAGRKKVQKGATRSAGPVPPINWMRGQKQYSLQDMLNEVTPKISFPQLLDVSPRLRRELAELLRSSVPRVRKVKGKEATAAAPVTLAKNSPLILTEAHGDDEVNCLYIDAWIGERLVGDVLVDGGAMLDLISQETSENLGLEKHNVKGLGMRLADDSLVRLDHYVWADIIVAGIIARIKAYIVPVSVTYKVLLSRRWLKRVKGIEYHESNVLYIEGVDGVKRKVRGKPATQPEIEVVRLPTERDLATEVESEEAEDAIEVLLHELDHWGDGGEGEEEEAGNG